MTTNNSGYATGASTLGEFSDNLLRCEAIDAINVLRSLPGWDKIADAYGEMGVSLDDLARDLEEHGPEGIIRLIDKDRADSHAEQEHTYRLGK